MLCRNARNIFQLTTLWEKNITVICKSNRAYLQEVVYVLQRKFINFLFSFNVFLILQKKSTAVTVVNISINPCFCWILLKHVKKWVNAQFAFSTRYKFIVKHIVSCLYIIYRIYEIGSKKSCSYTNSHINIFKHRWRKLNDWAGFI